MKRLLNLISTAIILLLNYVQVFNGFSQELKLGDVPDGNRSVPVHLIDLYDEDGAVIRPGDLPVLPFSPRQTCLKCHDYQKISRGWHFNAADPTTPPGRRGQPWILADQNSSTQIPVSYRPWPGVYKPWQVGLSAFRFVEMFGRHMPGGGIGEEENRESPDYFMRWLVSGKLEINCLSCHDRQPAHDQAEYANQVARQNYRWAASATSGFASVSGSAKDMPDNYNLYGLIMDRSDVFPPTVSYNTSRFHANGKIFLDIVRKVPNQRCYFCHSTQVLNNISQNRWTVDEDVHLAAGMMCVDCHRNGLNHAMIRGYEGESQVREESSIATFTCKGCHIPRESNELPDAGRLGAPEPEHSGIPPVHFDKLTCTACHSGPGPAKNAVGVKTSRAHGLGTRGVNKSVAALPHIYSPVFVQEASGKIAPHNLFWPAYWGQLKDEKVTPLSPEFVTEIAGDYFVQSDTVRSGDWTAFTREQIAAVLESITHYDSTAGRPVYICGGNLYQLGEAGEVTATNHPAAKPYTWPIAHDVRPAAQSLGIRGCRDCHVLDSPLYFGKVEVDSPLEISPQSIEMIQLQRSNSFYVKVFALTFAFRPWLRYLTFITAVLLASILVLYAFKGLAILLKAASVKNESN